MPYALQVYSIGAHKYAFTPSLKNRIIEDTKTEDTISISFDGLTLSHTYRTETGQTTETVDILETFRTYPREAQRTLERYGHYPLGTATNGFEPCQQSRS
jgi:hypothetical protein